MKVLVSVAAARRPARRPLDEFLTKDQIKFLKKWCVDGAVAKGDLQTPFKAIRKAFEKAGEYKGESVPALYRGVNLTAKEFDTLIRTGELPVKGNVQSWTSNAGKAHGYAQGSMNAKPKAFAVVFKKPKGTDAIIDLGDIAGRVGDHFKEGSPYNKEFILPGAPLKSTEVVWVSGPGFNMHLHDQYVKTLQKLLQDGFFVKPPTAKLLLAHLKVTPSGKLTEGKSLRR